MMFFYMMWGFLGGIILTLAIFFMWLGLSPFRFGNGNTDEHKNYSGVRPFAKAVLQSIGLLR